MTPAGVILAAGASTRMGTPKALLTYRGETFLDRLIGLLSARCAPVVAVLGHNAAAIRAQLRRDALFAVNPGYARGQLSSLQCGLRAIPPGAPALFTLVDHPALDPATLALLAGRIERGDAPLVIPRHQGRRGHPVCCAPEIVAELLALAPDSDARSVLHRYHDRAVFLDVDDPGVLLDVDDPGAYQRLIEVPLP